VFDWLFEGRLSVYLLLGVLGALTAAMWSRMGFVLFHTVAPARGVEPSRKRWELLEDEPSSARRDAHRRLAVPPIVLAVLAVLAGVYFLLDRLVETRREQITRKLHEMAAAVRARDVDRIFAHFSEQFSVQTRAGRRNKADFRSDVEANLDRITDLVVWDVQFPDDSGRVNFRVNPKGPQVDGLQVTVRSEFVLDPDQQWRLRHFEILLGLGGDTVLLP
jgi:hypothetical protein